MTRLADELVGRFEGLGRALSTAEVTFDRASPENELVIRVRPRVASSDKADLDIAVGSEDTVVMTLGRFGLMELVASDYSALADEVAALTEAVVEGRVKERLVTVAGKPASSELQVALHDRTCSFNHTKFRLGRREELLLEYAAY